MKKIEIVEISGKVPEVMKKLEIMVKLEEIYPEKPKTQIAQEAEYIYKRLFKNDGFVLTGKPQEIIEQLEIMEDMAETMPDLNWFALSLLAKSHHYMEKALKEGKMEPPENPKHFTNEWEPNY